MREKGEKVRRDIQKKRKKLNKQREEEEKQGESQAISVMGKDIEIQWRVSRTI